MRAVWRGLRVTASLAVLWAALAAFLPLLMARYRSFRIEGGAFDLGLDILGTGSRRRLPNDLVDLYEAPLEQVLFQATARSLLLIAGAAIFALVVGITLGAVAAAWRRRSEVSGTLLVALTAAAAVPSFFLAFFLQLAVIFLAAAAGRRVLPIAGFGVDEHLLMPLLAVGLPAVALTAQVSAARFSEVLESEFVRVADAKGLLPSWILRIHVLPHALPATLEALGSGLRISVASLPIVEYLFVWGGIGYVGLQSVAVRDASGLTAATLVLAGMFSVFSLIAELPRRG